MKWSQAICASILVDSFHTTSSSLNEVLVERTFRPNLLTPDWRLPPKTFGTRSQNYQPMHNQAPDEPVPGLNF